jgi:ketose-bisphosphate aldolase
MALSSLPSLLLHARDGGYALGYFEAWDSYSLEAVLEAAEAEQSPVILGFGCMMLDRGWLDASGIEILGHIGRTIAERATVPTALLLNEAHTCEQAMRGMDVGFNSVMVDTSTWTWDASVSSVARLVREARARGVAVEAELGRLPDAADGGIDDASASLTDPETAAAFVEQTGIDCLAVSIGNVHLLTGGHAPVDLRRLEAIHARVPVPLVIHGGTSFPPSEVPRAIRAGALKFNVGTSLKRAFLGGVRDAVRALPANANAHDALGSHKSADLMNAGKAPMQDRIRELMRLYGSSGRNG